MEHARGFKKSGEIENNKCIYNLLNTKHHYCFYEMFIIHVEVCVHIYKYISHYCFAKCIFSTPLDYCDLFYIRNNRGYCLCKICSDNHEIVIIAKVKKVAIIEIIKSNRKR
jgi:hypothetical protein